jgi:hypothetical protein
VPLAGRGATALSVRSGERASTTTLAQSETTHALR